jgi:hypothetical protein
LAVTTYHFTLDKELIEKSRVILLNYREDGTTPYVVCWKHGLKEMKV